MGAGMVPADDAFDIGVEQLTVEPDTPIILNIVVRLVAPSSIYTGVTKLLFVGSHYDN